MKEMNWKKLTIGIVIINLFGWVLLEVWSFRYAESNVDVGAGWMFALHLISYYTLAIGSRIPEPKKILKDITPANCPGHDWQPYRFGSSEEECVICGAKRGVLK